MDDNCIVRMDDNCIVGMEVWCTVMCDKGWMNYKGMVLQMLD